MMHVSGVAAEVAAGGHPQRKAAASPAQVKSDTSEHVVIGAAFNAMSTVFVMLMASCAKLAGERPASNHMLVLLQSLGLLASRCYGGGAALSHQGCPSFAGHHGIPVMEIVLARSSVILVCALLTVAVRRQDPRGNRQWLLLARSLVGFTGSAAYGRCTGGTCTLHALLVKYSLPIPCAATCLCRHLPLVYRAASAATV